MATLDSNASVTGKTHPPGITHPRMHNAWLYDQAKHILVYVLHGHTKNHKFVNYSAIGKTPYV